MSSRRPPMTPPGLPGFEHVRLIGSGGYADVFLYNQQMPRRQVAIKVLTAEARDTLGRRQFFDEANAMASVSTHPFIVSVFHADVSAEGHPYLVMEYYPRDNFMVRARTEQIPVFEALRVGIQVASAVETAHRAGILHRDIKPANILTSEYDRPGLTDFGIATAVAGGQEAEGMSIPWSPPEVVNGSDPGDVTADVYSLAATVYTLLSGRSPFEVPGESNRTFDLIPRIEAGGPVPTGRPDVPASVERILRHGMSRAAQDRPPSAAAFARILQAAEVELGFAPTQLEIRQDPRDVRSRGHQDEDDGTRLKGPTVIHSQSDTSSVTNRVTGIPPDGMVTGVPGSSGTGIAPPSDVEGRTVARGSGSASTPQIVHGVGAIPAGLGAPEWGQPSSSMSMDGVADGVPGKKIAGHAGESSRSDDLFVASAPNAGEAARPSLLKVVVGVAVGIVLLVSIGVVFSKLGGSECDEGRAGCPSVSTETAVGGATLELPIPAVTMLPITDYSEGTVTIMWRQDGADPSEYKYRILNQDGHGVQEVDGSDLAAASGKQAGATGNSSEQSSPVFKVKVAVDPDNHCFRVKAIRNDGRYEESDPLVCPPG